MSSLHRYAVFVASSTLVLIIAGGLVTSTGSGLAVPDWPTTYGHFMLSFPLSKMVGGIFYEHGHRMIASAVGCLTIGLAVWIWLRDDRRWVKRIGGLAVVAISLQGLLGGITVLYFLPAPVSIGHAALAQIFFCLTIGLALFTSPGWRSNRPAVDDRLLRRLAASTTILVYLQILVGATMRHMGAGLAIPDFPLVFGGLIPPEWTGGIATHFAHRAGAVLVSIAVLATATCVWKNHRNRPELAGPALLLPIVTAVQVALGAWTVLSDLAVPVNTAHVATGAALLGTSLVLALRASRSLLVGSREAAVAPFDAVSSVLPRAEGGRA